jgi:hypothetical protein
MPGVTKFDHHPNRFAVVYMFGNRISFTSNAYDTIGGGYRAPRCHGLRHNHDDHLGCRDGCG